MDLTESDLEIQALEYLLALYSGMESLDRKQLL